MARFGLNPKHSFDGFLVTDSNRAAYTAALLATADRSRIVSPLLIRGGRGTGKTHLIQAIGNTLAKLSLKVSYQTSESLTNTLIAALKEDKISKFNAWIRGIDVLLIDDIEFLSGRIRTQQAFLELFTSVMCPSTLLAISANHSWKTTLKVTHSLARWLTAGTKICIHDADETLKAMIIRQRAEELDINICNKVVSYIATECLTIRQAEGVLNRALAECSILNAKLNLETAQRATRAYCCS